MKSLHPLTERCLDFECPMRNSCLRFLMRESGQNIKSSCRPLGQSSEELCPVFISSEDT